MRKDMEIQISSESDEDGKTGLPKKSLRDFTIDEIIASEAAYVGKLKYVLSLRTTRDDDDQIVLENTHTHTHTHTTPPHDTHMLMVI